MDEKDFLYKAWMSGALECLKEMGIKVRLEVSMLAVDRTSMCVYAGTGCGCPEETVYPVILDLLGEKFNNEHVRLYWAGKTDDDLFLDNIFSK